MTKLSLINGPNLNMLGLRERDLYGDSTLEEIISRVTKYAAERDILLSPFQSNSEGMLCDHIQSLKGKVDGIVINAGAYTHTSIAIRDALLSVAIPFVEVHLSNIYSREEFRHSSYLSDIAKGIIVGFGPDGYLLAVEQFSRMLKNTK